MTGTTRRAALARWFTALLVATLALAGCGPEQDTAPTPGAPTSQSRTQSPTRAESPSASPSPTPSPTPSAPEDPLPEGPVTALLLGTDSRTPGSMTGNADTIMLAQISADRQTLSLVSITRDSWVEIPGLGEGKINSAFSRGGTETIRETVSQMFGGLEIDYVAQTDFEGFIALTRALDGFTVENANPSTVTVNSTGRVVDFTGDTVHLENTDGLIYVRQRKGLPAGDLDRAERQRAAVIGMLERIDEIAKDDPAALPELFGLVATRVKLTGELSIDDMVALAALSQELTRDDVISLQAPITGFGTRNGQSVNLVDEEQTAALGAALRDGDLRAYVEEYGTDYRP